MYITETEQKISKKGLDKVRLVPKDSVLVSCTATLGRIAIVKRPLTTNQQINAVVCNDKILPRYFAYIMEEIGKNMQYLTNNVGVKHINQEMLNNIQVPLPPLDVQQKIVDEIEKIEKLLSDSNKKIDKNDKNITELLNNFKQKQEKLNEYIKLNEDTKNPKILKQDYFTYVDIDAVENGTGKINFNKQVESQKAPSRARRVAHDKSILLSTVRPYLKAFAYIDNELENTIYSTGFAIIRSTDENKLLSKFLYYLFMYNNNLMEQMKAAMPKGQYPSINDKDIRNFLIPIPPIKEQEKIVSQIEELEKQIAEAHKVIDNSKQQKQAILDKYLK